MSYIDAVQKNLTAGRHIDAGNQFGESGLAAPVRAGNSHEPLIDGKAYVTQDFRVILSHIADMF